MSVCKHVFGRWFTDHHSQTEQRRCVKCGNAWQVKK